MPISLAELCGIDGPCAPIYAWGLRFIEALQVARNPMLDKVMMGFSLLGQPLFLGVLVAGLYLGINRGRALRLALVLLASLAINAWLKGLLSIPRPYLVHPRLFVIQESGYASPSCHAQASFLIYVLLAAWSKRPWAIVLSIILLISIGLSRVYLGVHYPSDVILAWCVAGLILGLYLIFEKRLAGLGASLAPRWQVCGLALFCLICLGLSPRMAGPCGACFGLGISLILWRRLSPEPQGRSLVYRAVSVILGLVILGLIHVGLQWGLPLLGQSNLRLFTFIGYGGCGIWVGLALPYGLGRTMRA